MTFYVELDEKGVVIHNTLLLFPRSSHLIITRQIEKGCIVTFSLSYYLQGKAFIRTNERDDWKEMEIDDSFFAYRYDMDLESSGAFSFVTSFLP